MTMCCAIVSVSLACWCRRVSGAVRCTAGGSAVRLLHGLVMLRDIPR